MGRPKTQQIPAVETRRVRVADLVPAEYNPRKISARAMAGLRASLERFGELGGIVVNDRTGRIVGGHQRVKALAALGVAEVEVRVIDVDAASERAVNLALNHSGIGGEWDEEMLSAVLAEVHRDLPTAFDELLFRDLWADAGAVLADGHTDEDDAPDLPDRAVTEAGDMWLLGDHRIICGSSTDAGAVGRLLSTARPHLMVTDPPYGVEYDASWRNEACRSNGAAIGGKALGKVLNDDNADWCEAWALFPGDVAYVWHDGLKGPAVGESLAACGFVMRAQIVWAKSTFAIGRGDYHWQHEPCWYAVRDGQKSHWNGSRKEATVWSIKKPNKNETGHSTQKPIECMRRPIENNSRPGDVVYEPFSGSGTTIIAGEQTRRHVYAVELAPEYVDVAVRRWQAFTGRHATLDGDGRTFSAIRGDRHG